MEELLSKKSPAVMEYISQLDSARAEDSEKYMDLACDLFDMSQELGNDDLKDFASCTLGDACCRNTQFSQALFYLNSGIDGLKKTDEYILIARVYNELGIIYRSHGHVIKSLENFMESIDIAREHRLYLQEAASCSNFAALCEEMGASYQALEYHYRAVECCGFIENERVRDEILVDEYALMAKLYVMLGDDAQAKILLGEVEKLEEKYPDFDNLFAVRVCRWCYYYKIEDREKCEKFKKLCIDSFYKCSDYILYYDEIISFMQLMLKEREFVELQKIFDRIDDLEINEEIINLHLHMAQFKVQMYKELGDRESMMEAGYKYFTYDEQKKADAKKSFMTTLRLKSELTQQKTTNLFLSAAAETDILTGLANRSKLNTVIDELFIMANKEGKSLGVEMMDVDFFKHVNDNYGHAKGDELLASMGRFFRELVSKKVFIARYGGDEFVLYYYDMTDEEILDITKKIQDQMLVIGEELKLGKVTVSQGIVNLIPAEYHRAWDFLNAADSALYHVKEHGKAAAKLIHSRKELGVQQSV